MFNAQGRDDGLRAEAARAWPGFDWTSATVERGAFHDVAVIAGEVVARISRSRFAADAMPDRVELLAALGGQVGDVSAPAPVGTLERWSAERAGVLLSYVAGDHRDVDEAFAVPDLGRALAAVETTGPALAGRALRAWCGGAGFPRLVSDVVVPHLAGDVAEAATTAVNDLIEAEQAATSGPVHGDLTPYNLLWNDRGLTGILDWDAAGFGDPAVDIAGILTTLGTEVAAALTDRPTLERASRHRATLPLQVAVAGHLHDDRRLFRAGLSNFQRRHAAGALRWPLARS